MSQGENNQPEKDDPFDPERLRRLYTPEMAEAARRAYEERQAKRATRKNSVMAAVLQELERQDDEIAALKRKYRDALETINNCLVAAGASEHLDEMEKQVKAVGTHPSHFIRYQFDKLKEIVEFSERFDPVLKEHIAARRRLNELESHNWPMTEPKQE